MVLRAREEGKCQDLKEGSAGTFYLSNGCFPSSIQERLQMYIIKGIIPGKHFSTILIPTLLLFLLRLLPRST